MNVYESKCLGKKKVILNWILLFVTKELSSFLLKASCSAWTSWQQRQARQNTASDDTWTDWLKTEIADFMSKNPDLKQRHASGRIKRQAGLFLLDYLKRVDTMIRYSFLTTHHRRRFRLDEIELPFYSIGPFCIFLIPHPSITCLSTFFTIHPIHHQPHSSFFCWLNSLLHAQKRLRIRR